MGHITTPDREANRMTDPMQGEGENEPRAHPRCSARCRDGSACSNRPMRGGKVCRMHGGAAPQVRATSERRTRQAAAERSVATYGLPRDIDPAAALLEEVHRTAGHVAWLAGKVAELDDEALVWGTAEIAEKGATEFPGTDTKESARPSVWLDLYHRERAHFVKVSKAALDAGVSERLVQLAEQQGTMLAEVMRRSADALLDRATSLLDDQAAALLRREWPGWVAHVLPAEIAAATGGSTG